MINYIIVLFSISMICMIPITYGQMFDEDVFPITKSPSMKDVEIDGNWSNPIEWKKSSHKLIQEENSRINLRAAHYEDFLYFLIDYETDYTLNTNSDKATICVDTKNDKQEIPNENHYCFTVVLGHNQGSIFQGGSDSVIKNNYKKIENIEEFIAVAKISGENNRYSKVLHPTFEFKIPVELIGRSDNYGFLVSVYEADSGKFYTWPENLREHIFSMPPPNTWGNLVSPDKTLPEFHLGIVLLLSIIPVIIISYFRKNISFQG